MEYRLWWKCSEYLECVVKSTNFTLKIIEKLINVIDVNNKIIKTVSQEQADKYKFLLFIICLIFV